MAYKRETGPDGFQTHIIQRLEELFGDRDLIILKNDPQYLQGIPDLSVFVDSRWAMLETKCGVDKPHRPNQDYYVDKADRMSFSAFIYPENEEEVISALIRHFNPYIQ